MQILRFDIIESFDDLDQMSLGSQPKRLYPKKIFHVQEQGSLEAAQS